MRAGFLGRIAAAARGEVAADALEAYRRAGTTVWRTLHDLDERHHERAENERAPWSQDSGMRAERLCAWNAFCLQTLGDSLLDADYRRDPGTVGHVPAWLAEHALAFYAPVEEWVSRAYQARCNPHFKLDVSVPAGPLPWPQQGFETATHADSLLHAVQRMRSQVDPLVALYAADVPEAHVPTATCVRRLAGEASAKIEYAHELWESGVPASVTREVARCSREAADRLFLLGQVAAMPELAAQVDAALAAVSREAAPAAETPAEPKEPVRRTTRTVRSKTAAIPFDEWRLTDPALRANMRTLPAARKALSALWKADPAPAQTLALQEEIEAALARGAIAYATDADGERVGCFYLCPWGPVYVARRTVALGNQTLRPLQQFTLQLVPPDERRGTPFQRRLLVETFAPAKKLEYKTRN